jgi:hypothetical protein
LETTTSLSLYKRYATVAYYTQNFTILSIESISPPMGVSPEATSKIAAGLITAYTAVLTPLMDTIDPTNLDFANLAASYSTQYDLGWALRLYHDDYKSYKGGPIAILQNFLAVPLQFATTALQRANFTGVPKDLYTTATTAQIHYKATAEPWTLFVFSILTVSLTFWAIGCLGWAHFSNRPSPNSSFFAEIDILKSPNASTSPNTDSQAIGNHLTPLTSFQQLIQESAGNGTSGRVKNAIRGKRLYVGTSNNQQIVMLVRNSHRERRVHAEARVSRTETRPRKLVSARVPPVGGSSDERGPLKPLIEGKAYA